MCTDCLSRCKKPESIQSEDELWTLFNAAYKQYQSDVILDAKLYNRFVSDLISYYLPISTNDEKIWRTHNMHINALEEFLTERNDLVEKYFNQESFTRELFDKLYHEFNHTDKYRLAHDKLGVFSDVQISVITEFINDNKLFNGEITCEVLKDFFSCNLSNPLYARVVGLPLLLLDSLAYNSFIVRDWQYLVSKNELIASQRTMKIVSRTALSSRLAEIKLTKCTMPNKIKSLIKKLQEMN